jgi:antitoxin MazE
VVVIPKDQAWFYSPEWQKDEMEVDKQKGDGKINKASNKEELFEKLGLNKI